MPTFKKIKSIFKKDPKSYVSNLKDEELQEYIKPFPSSSISSNINTNIKHEANENQKLESNDETQLRKNPVFSNHLDFHDTSHSHDSNESLNGLPLSKETTPPINYNKPRDYDTIQVNGGPTSVATYVENAITSLDVAKKPSVKLECVSLDYLRAEVAHSRSRKEAGAVENSSIKSTSSVSSSFMSSVGTEDDVISNVSSSGLETLYARLTAHINTTSTLHENVVEVDDKTDDNFDGCSQSSNCNNNNGSRNSETIASPSKSSEQDKETYCEDSFNNSDVFSDGEVVEEANFCSCNLKQFPQTLWKYSNTLTKIILESNSLEYLPDELFSCYQLRYLSVSDNDIGDIPPALASLTNLSYLDLSKNIIACVPDSIRHCKSLRVLDMSVNPLERLSECLTQLVDLEEMFMIDCYFEFLPSSIGRMCNLQVLELRDNQLTDLPQSIQKLTKLKRLDLGSNMFADWPAVVCSLESLKELWLDNNELNRISLEIGNLFNLSYLDVGKNFIRSVPSQIEKLSKLEDLLLNDNEISELPDNIGFLSNLNLLNLHKNNLMKVPASVGKCKQLVEVDLSLNILQVIPASFALLQKLKILLLDGNELTKIPKDIGKCVSLEILQLSRNQISRLPDSIGDLNNLKVLNVCQNLLSNLPSTFLQLNLNALWISSNQSKPDLSLQIAFDAETNQQVAINDLLPQNDKNERDYSLIIKDSADDASPKQRERGQTLVDFDLDATTYSNDVSLISKDCKLDDDDVDDDVTRATSDFSSFIADHQEKDEIDHIDDVESIYDLNETSIDVISSYSIKPGIKPWSSYQNILELSQDHIPKLSPKSSKNEESPLDSTLLEFEPYNATKNPHPHSDLSSDLHLSDPHLPSDLPSDPHLSDSHPLSNPLSDPHLSDPHLLSDLPSDPHLPSDLPSDPHLSDPHLPSDLPSDSHLHSKLSTDSHFELDSHFSDPNPRLPDLHLSQNSQPPDPHPNPLPLTDPIPTLDLDSGVGNDVESQESFPDVDPLLQFHSDSLKMMKKNSSVSNNIHKFQKIINNRSTKPPLPPKPALKIQEDHEVIQQSSDVIVAIEKPVEAPRSAQSNFRDKLEKMMQQKGTSKRREKTRKASVVTSVDSDDVSNTGVHAKIRQRLSSSSLDADDKLKSRHLVAAKSGEEEKKTLEKQLEQLLLVDTDKHRVFDHQNGTTRPNDVINMTSSRPSVDPSGWKDQLLEHLERRKAEKMNDPRLSDTNFNRFSGRRSSGRMTTRTPAPESVPTCKSDVVRPKSALAVVSPPEKQLPSYEDHMLRKAISRQGLSDVHQQNPPSYFPMRSSESHESIFNSEKIQQKSFEDPKKIRTSNSHDSLLDTNYYIRHQPLHHQPTYNHVTNINAYQQQRQLAAYYDRCRLQCPVYINPSPHYTNYYQPMTSQAYTKAPHNDVYSIKKRNMSASQYHRKRKEAESVSSAFRPYSERSQSTSSNYHRRNQPSTSKEQMYHSKQNYYQQPVVNLHSNHELRAESELRFV